MKEFSFSPEESQYDIENILRERKQKIATQQIIFTLILLFILIILGLWIGKKSFLLNLMVTLMRI